jgi:hypothetical protein
LARVNAFLRGNCWSLGAPVVVVKEGREDTIEISADDGFYRCAIIPCPVQSVNITENLI